MVTYPEDKFIPGKTPTQSDLAQRGQVLVVIDGSAVPWFDVTWGVDVDAAAALASELTGAASFDTANPGPVQAALTDGVNAHGVYFSAPYPLPSGVVTAVQLAGDAEATVALEAQ